MISARIVEGHFDKHLPVFSDVKDFHLDQLDPDEEVDGLSGGFPCQASSCQCTAMIHLLYCSSARRERQGLERSWGCVMREAYYSKSSFVFGMKLKLLVKDCILIAKSNVWNSCDLKNCLRKFLWLENVANILSNALADVHSYLLKEIP